MNGYERYSRKHGKLHPVIAQALQPHFPTIFRVADVRVRVHNRAWWDRFHKTSIWVLGTTIMVASRYKWNMSNPFVVATMAHELYHVWQWHRDGAGNMAANTLSSIIRKYTGRHWHSSRYEREAIAFQKQFRDGFSGALPVDPR